MCQSFLDMKKFMVIHLLLLLYRAKISPRTISIVFVSVSVWCTLKVGQTRGRGSTATTYHPKLQQSVLTKKMSQSFFILYEYQPWVRGDVVFTSRSMPRNYAWGFKWNHEFLGVLYQKCIIFKSEDIWPLKLPHFIYFLVSKLEIKIKKFSLEKIFIVNTKIGLCCIETCGAIKCHLKRASCLPLANRKKGRKEFQSEAWNLFEIPSDGATCFNVTIPLFNFHDGILPLLPVLISFYSLL